MRARLLTVVFVIALAASFAGASAPVKSVFVRNSSLLITDNAGAAERQITSGETPKFLPAWSPDGNRIAFAREDEAALADIVVVDQTGTVLMQTPFRPSGTDVSGMRFVEALGWLSNDRILVGGSVNPSTVEYAVLDAASGRQVAEYAADGFTLLPSPDGRHVAYQGYIPHFSNRAGAERFCIDHECDFDTASTAPSGSPDRQSEFFSTFAWAPDSSRVAVCERNVETKQIAIVTRTVLGTTLVRQTTIRSDKPVDLAWSAVAGDFATAAEPGRGVPLGQTPDDVAQRTGAAEMRAMRRSSAAAGNVQADFWCASCAIKDSPRMNGPDPKP